MNKFKEYCKLKQIVEKDKSNIDNIMDFLDKRRKDFRTYFFSSIVMGGFFILPVFIITLIYFDLVSNGMKVFLGIVFTLDILFGFLFCFIHYLDCYEYYHDKNNISKKLKIPNQYLKLKKYCEIYNNNEKRIQDLHNEITTKVYLESINKRSDELNVYEFRILEKLFEEDNKERVKLEKSVILNY